MSGSTGAGSSEDSVHCRRPPLCAPVRCRYLVSVEPARDLTQTLGGGVLGLDPLEDELRNRDRATRTRAGLRLRSSRPASFRDHALQLVDRDQSCAAGHLDGLD